jgi:hypothetical protein
MRRIFLASILLLISGMAHAAGPAAPLTGHSSAFSLPQAGTAPGGAGSQATRIETDQKTGAIRFIVKGREEARIDATGLHVRQGVYYGGTITATGVAAYGKASPEPKP